jgi:pimeloyl-ACP methyl ester carboxylesterase
MRAAGGVDRAAGERMLREGRSAELVEIDGAGHDVHLDRPDAWKSHLAGFVARLPAPSRL